MKCTICGKPWVEGQALYGPRSDTEAGTCEHYDCKFPEGYKDPRDQAREALASLERAQQELRELGEHLAAQEDVIDSRATTPQKRRR